MLKSLHFRVAAGVIATIVLISGVYFLVDYRSNRERLLSELQQSADQLSEFLLQDLLEIAMIGKHPELLQHAVERLGVKSSARRIQLMNLNGEVRFASVRSDLGHQFSVEGQGCRVCHSSGAPPERRSEFMEIQGEQVLRSVNPVPNNRECAPCHEQGPRYNGVLLIDFPTAAVEARLRNDFEESLLRLALMVLSTLIVLGLLMNKMVIRPLKSLTRATAGLAEGDPAAEFLGTSGADEISRLARSFREMSARVQGSIKDLREQQAYLQNLINSLPDGLIVVDARLRVEMTNQAADSIWSLQELEQIISQRILFPEVGRILLRTFETGSPGISEIRLGGTDGAVLQQSRFFEISCAPLLQTKGQISKVILLVRNVTSRKLIEMQARRADRLASVGSLAAGFAHEINNPMAAITTSAEGLARYVETSGQILEPEKQEIDEYLMTISEAAQRCSDITRRLLSASAERGAEGLDTVDLGRLAREAERLVRLQARRQRAQVEVNSSGETSVTGNSEQLSQLILNLLMNGLEAVDEGGQVTLSVAGNGRHVELSVVDNGCGIAEHNLDHIFDPFFTTKIDGQGTGLGLYISQWIVRQHHAELQVHSSVGKGTTFSVRFPAAEEGAA